MTVAVRYYSRSGNTKKVAEAIAEALGVQALDLTAPLEEHVDLLFLGCALYAGGIDPAVNRYLADNAEKIGKLAAVSTTAIAKSAGKPLAKAAAACGVTLAEKEFSCRGAFGPFHKSRPNQTDLAEAAAYAEAMLSCE